VAASRAGAEEQNGRETREEGGSGQARARREGGGLTGCGSQLAHIVWGPRASSAKQSYEPADSAERRATKEKKGLAGGVAACVWLTVGPRCGGQLWVAAGRRGWAALGPISMTQYPFRFNPKNLN
jgi:hypothetical protein